MSLEIASEKAAGIAPAAFLLLALSVPGCDRPVAPAGDPPLLRDVALESGLDFVHETGAEGGYLLPEIMGGGVALLDHDGDGDLDAYLVNGAGPSRLYRQEAGGRFVDATGDSGLGGSGYGMGVAVGDVDNDGDLDIYATYDGPDRLFRNRGDGTFDEVSAAAGIAVDGWSSSATFLDYDRDGRLDLYVARYVEHDESKRCTDSAGRPDYCSPSVFAPLFDVLLHNDGDGTFSDVSDSAGILRAIGAGLGVVAADLDDDGWTDLYVANDGDANQLWINQHDGTFRDEALLAGVAYNMQGEAEAGMGVIAADLDDDADLDLFVTHLAEETNTYYRNRGGARGFEDAGGGALATDSLVWTGFGTAAFDLEADGDLDLFVANGRVTRGRPGRTVGDLPAPPWDAFAEPDRLFLNGGGGAFTSAPGAALGGAQPRASVSRGVAAGDVDADGDLDLLVGDLAAGPRLYLNEAEPRGNWLLVRAIDPRHRRDAIGARLIAFAGERRLRRDVGRGFSYLSSSDARAHFGFGAIDRLDRFEVRWPDGVIESFEVSELNRAIVLERGAGVSP